MKIQLYTIRAVTNLHVGSGDHNYGVVDNLVQRDPATSLPTIHGSSLKGAIREFCDYHWQGNQSRLAEIFGDDSRPSAYHFLPAQILGLPLRANKRPYMLATSPSVLEDADRFAKQLGASIDIGILRYGRHGNKYKPKDGRPIIFRPTDDLVVEDFSQFEQGSSEGETALGHTLDIILLSDADFIMYCNNNHLPVIARNRMLGERNLWYEQVVPRESLFLTAVIARDVEHWETFEHAISGSDQLVHIGANASVGYGFTKFTHTKAAAHEEAIN